MRETVGVLARYLNLRAKKNAVPSWRALPTERSACRATAYIKHRGAVPERDEAKKRKSQG